jgi:hypothetical protein
MLISQDTPTFPENFYFVGKLAVAGVAPVDVYGSCNSVFV